MTLDTRLKILPLSRAAEFAGAVFVAMHLDPLTAGHARRLREIANGGQPVVVLLSDPPSPLLPARARAELAAALDSVTAVMVLDGQSSIPDVARPSLVIEEAADLERRDALVRRVFERHAATA